jgi:hypothetical protein
MSDVVLQLLVVLVLVMIEAVFVAAEIALVTLRHSRIEQLIDEGHRNARRVKRLVQDPAVSWPLPRSASRSSASWPRRTRPSTWPLRSCGSHRHVPC